MMLLCFRYCATQTEPYPAMKTSSRPSVYADKTPSEYLARAEITALISGRA
uniref:Uncharacterized protein n=1 Tax=Ciona intestinalis TaxID=7719 RepID=H2Y220_CIOIN